MILYINVKELMCRLLPRPRKKPDILDSDRAEHITELPIIKITGM